MGIYKGYLIRFIILVTFLEKTILILLKPG